MLIIRLTNYLNWQIVLHRDRVSQMDGFFFFRSTLMTTLYFLFQLAYGTTTEMTHTPVGLYVLPL
jgi:hypothetical protein